jgi:histidyl-tRNA synthetase
VVELMHADAGALAEPGPQVCLVAVGDAARRQGFALAERLRRKLPGLRVLVGGQAAGFKAQLRRADKCGARFALIVGEDEVAAQRYGLKDLRDGGSQQSLAEDELLVSLAAAFEPVD